MTFTEKTAKDAKIAKVYQRKILINPDGTKVYICIIIDAYSHFCLTAVAGTNKTSAWVAQATQEAVRFFGPPEALLSDNGREFVSVWEESLTQFGHLLNEHKTTAPCVPLCWYHASSTRIGGSTGYGSSFPSFRCVCAFAG
ncbi:MAG TPA: transposase [Anaerolineae bacterium]|nr:transposase [Anaerolineae bacterium]